MYRQAKAAFWLLHHAPTLLPVREAKAITARKVDGRTLRKTNRTVAFATRVTEDFDNRVREIAERKRP
jgi:hypothetical protein